MADYDHLKGFAGTQTGALATAIIDEFTACYRGFDVTPAEYAQRLRQILEARFAEEMGE